MDEKLNFIRAMRLLLLEHHGAESPRTVCALELWSGGKRKRKKTRRKRRRKSKKPENHERKENHIRRKNHVREDDANK